MHHYAGTKEEDVRLAVERWETEGGRVLPPEWLDNAPIASNRQPFAAQLDLTLSKSPAPGPSK